MSHARFLLCLMLLCFSPRSVCCLAQAPAAESYLVTNARIFDVEAGRLEPTPRSILITGNRIVSIDQRQPSAGMSVLDVQGRVVLPGLIDLHSHLLLHPYDEATWNEQVLNESLELRTIRGTVAARRTLQAGFTTLRDLGTEGAGFADVALRDAIQGGIIDGPRVFAATKALVTTGGYGPMGFDPRWKMPVGAQAVDGVAECRRATREQIAAGADWIKVYADYRRRPGDVSTPTFSQEELNAIVQEASSAGIPVAAHATTNEGIRRSIAAGVKTIEHGYDASLQTLQQMREKGVVLCPTLAASESMANYGGWDPAQDPDPPRIVAAKTLIKNALTAGVNIACGSDVGVFAHGDNARELELMFAYGMSIEQVLRSATTMAASVLGEKSLGRVQADFLADLIVVNENPLENLFTLREPVIVIKDGMIVVDRRNAATAEPLSDNSNPDQLLETSPRNPDPSMSGLIQQLDSGSPNIIEINPAGNSPNPPPEKAETNKPIPDKGAAAYLHFELLLDGSFSRNGTRIAKGDLARYIAAQLERGIQKAIVSVSRKQDYRKLLETQEWLNTLGIPSVNFEVLDE